MSKFILWFENITKEDTAIVGGKNANLGEMISKTKIPVPEGFAITAEAYRYYIEQAGLKHLITQNLAGLNTKNLKDLAERCRKIREAISHGQMPKELEDEIIRNYRLLERKTGSKKLYVAVRSSATAEDLPGASFAGEQETYLNVAGEGQIIKFVKKCMASLFTDRAVSYRVDKGFDHSKIALSVAIQKMVRSDLACSGVMFTLDPDSGFRNVVYINGSYGLGEYIVQGTVNPDEFYVFKPTRALIEKKAGSKLVKLVRGETGNREEKVSLAQRQKLILADKQVLQLADYGIALENHYKMAMDIEWALDGENGKLYIVQARPETVFNEKKTATIEKYALSENGKLIVSGQSVGRKIGQGISNVILSVKDIGNFRKGEVLVTEMTDPDWEPIMKIAAAIVTNKGGRTCFSGDTTLLTDKGFLSFTEVMERAAAGEKFLTLSLNQDTLKSEWKPVNAVMKREAELISAEVSQTGNMSGNTLALTPDHRILTFENRELAPIEIQKALEKEMMVCAGQKIPPVVDVSDKRDKIAYVMGALSTDGCIQLSNRRGSITFTQKNTEEKQEFIRTVTDYFTEIYGKGFSVKEKISGGMVRGKPCIGVVNDYRCYSKAIATSVLTLQQNMVPAILTMEQSSIEMFLAGVIDGDGTYNEKSSRINIYCGDERLLQAIIVSCLRLGILPQVTRNRTCYNIQIVEGVELLLSKTKRVKGAYNRDVQGTRLFSARQLLGDIVKTANWKGRIKPYVEKNFLLDSEKIKSRILPMLSQKEQEQTNKILGSDLRMLRAKKVSDLGTNPVYNIEVEGNHNYFVFTRRYTPILVKNCHAAIVSRELGIPCVIGTQDATDLIKKGQKITVDCTEEDGRVFDGLLKFKVKKMELDKLPQTRTKILVNLGEPEMAFDIAQLPVDGVGLAREEFIINSYIGEHPLAMIAQGRGVEYIEKLARGIAKIGAAFHPRPIIVRWSDFKTNEYANLKGGKIYEPKEGNPMIGWRGCSRYVDPKFEPAFRLECKAIKKVRDEFGLTNVKVMLPFCRTVNEGLNVLKIMESEGLKRGKNGLEVYVMAEIPSNVILAEEFCRHFDGFSIGSNDLTQLTLGSDRDNEVLSKRYDERDPAVKALIAKLIETAKKHGRKVGICGQAPSDYPEYAEFLIKCGIDSISLNPDVALETKLNVAKIEGKR